MSKEFRFPLKRGITDRKLAEVDPRRRDRRPENLARFLDPLRSCARWATLSRQTAKAGNRIGAARPTAWPTLSRERCRPDNSCQAASSLRPHA
jgi:hypothetical protein